MSLLTLDNVHVRFATANGTVRAVNGVSLELGAGETLGLVGESGCGKSTLGKAIMRLVPISGGEIHVGGVSIAKLSKNDLAAVRLRMQMIFQDPYGSLNPRSSVARTIGQPLALAGWKSGAIKDRVSLLLEMVGLPDSARARFPHEFSGGQRQRIGIARALALNPELIICDEPVSALDVSVRAQVINLLEDLKENTGVSYLFISHDLSVVEHIADRVAIMYFGSVVEMGNRGQIWKKPQHPYTKALIEAAPIANPRLAKALSRTVLTGELPSPLDITIGCPFQSRCPVVQPKCFNEKPELHLTSEGSLVACHYA
jgi:oligopeptide/dipeptide ABC transporter ATP-binding protein